MLGVSSTGCYSICSRLSATNDSFLGACASGLLSFLGSAWAAGFSGLTSDLVSGLCSGLVQGLSYWSFLCGWLAFSSFLGSAVVWGGGCCGLGFSGDLSLLVFLVWRLGRSSSSGSLSQKSGFSKTLAVFLSYVLCFFSGSGGAGMEGLFYFFSGETTSLLPRDRSLLALDYFLLGEAFLILSSYSMSCFQKDAIFLLAVFITHSLGTSLPFSSTVNFIVMISSTISTEYKFFIGTFTFASSMLILLGASLIFTLLIYPKKAPWTTMNSLSLNLSPLSFSFSTTLMETRFYPMSTEMISVRALTIVCCSMVEYDIYYNLIPKAMNGEDRRGPTGS